VYFYSSLFLVLGKAQSIESKAQALSKTSNHKSKAQNKLQSTIFNFNIWLLEFILDFVLDI